MNDIDKLPMIHPGEILREVYMEPLGLTASALARELNVPRTRITRLINEACVLSLDTALRLARFFDTSPQYWINMQTSYDLKRAESPIKDDLRKITATSREAEQ